MAGCTGRTTESTVKYLVTVMMAVVTAKRTSHVVQRPRIVCGPRRLSGRYYCGGTVTRLRHFEIYTRARDNYAPALLARLATTLQIIVIRARVCAGVSDDASVCHSNAHRFDALSSYNARATVTRILFNALRNYLKSKTAKTTNK